MDLLADSVAGVGLGLPLSLGVAGQGLRQFGLGGGRAVGALLVQGEQLAALPSGARLHLLVVPHLLRGDIHGCGLLGGRGCRYLGEGG